MKTQFTFADLIKSFALSTLLFALFSGLNSWVPGISWGLNQLPLPYSFVVQYLIQLVVLFVPLYLFVIRPYSAGWKDFGMKKVSVGKLILTVLAGYISYILISTGLLALFTALQTDLPGYQPQESYLPFFGTDVKGLVVAFIFIVLVAPFLEELYFRGFVYRTLAQRWPLWISNLVAALFFAGAHFQIQNVIPLILLGLVLNTIYQRTGSLWTSIAFHVFNNLIAFNVQVFLYFHPDLIPGLG